MTAPTTAAGLHVLGHSAFPGWRQHMERDIAAIEAEAANAEHERLAAEWVTPSEEAKRRQDAVHDAIAAYKARLTEAVEALPIERVETGGWIAPNLHREEYVEVVGLPAVLDAIEETE
jgi:hypothetical protein